MLFSMDTTETERLIRGLVVGDPDVIAGIAARVPDGDLLVAAALVAPAGRALLGPARDVATTSAGRRVIAIASAYLGGDPDRALLHARDHLADDPDHLLVAAIAATLTDRSTL
jgi:hypothetical protein